MRKLEAELGRTFTWPLSEQDSILLLVHLLSKGLSVDTFWSYLSGTRRLALAQGVPRPPNQSDLAKTILKGYENLKRNPVKAVAEATNRPVSIPFLRLLRHAAISFWKRNLNDKQGFWAITLASFWALCEWARSCATKCRPSPPHRTFWVQMSSLCQGLPSPYG